MSYVYQKFPKVKYHATKEPVTVANEEEERKLGEGWEDTPAAFPFYDRKPNDPIPNTVDELNAELDHWYGQLNKEQKGTPWRDSIDTRIEHLKFRKQMLIEEKSSAKIEQLPTLPQLPNKDSLLSELTFEINHRSPVSVIFIDLDHFKKVNDTLGHQAGDDCLEKVVALIGSVILGKGKLFRCGGDEFVAVLPNFETGEATASGERMRLSIDLKNPCTSVKVTTSIGVACSDQIDSGAISLVDAADQAMYQSKKLGRNRVTPWGIQPAISSEERNAYTPEEPSEGEKTGMEELRQVAGELTERVGGYRRVRGAADKIAIFEKLGCLQNFAGTFRHYPDIKQAVRDLHNTIGWFVSTDSQFESAKEGRENRQELEERYNMLISVLNSKLILPVMR